VLNRSQSEKREAVAQHDDRRNIEGDDREPITRRGEYVLDRMVAQRRRHVDIGVRMMQRVKSPQERHCMLAPMYQVTD